jgi:hypothetical protein
MLVYLGKNHFFVKNPMKSPVDYFTALPDPPLDLSFEIMQQFRRLIFTFVV